jgi:hypothetical protein
VTGRPQAGLAPTGGRSSKRYEQAMSKFESITIRDVESSDLETFYEHQLDSEAIRKATCVGKDPKDKIAFDAHCDKSLNSLQITKKTIVAERVVLVTSRAIGMQKT